LFVFRPGYSDEGVNADDVVTVAEMKKPNRGNRPDNQEHQEEDDIISSIARTLGLMSDDDDDDNDAMST